MGNQRDFSQRGRSKFSSKIFADKMMEYIFAVAVALHIAVAMTPEDSEKGVGRSAREFILPETDGDREAAGTRGSLQLPLGHYIRRRKLLQRHGLQCDNRLLQRSPAHP